ncbi:DUF6193 family natural product biosynthesis protein [Kitasatospora phosalacinea]|uniref:DUF6193 family natural product biosynthesis protein n=1 Tax=Kitasatospora phosalacinea TaxID=2065 RepID=UPI0036497C1F
MPTPTYETQAERDAAAAAFGVELAELAAAAGLSLPEPKELAWFTAKFEGERKHPVSSGRTDELVPDQVAVYWMRDGRNPYLHLRRGGVTLAMGRTPDLTEILRGASRWLAGADLTEIRRTTPFLHVEDWALAHEQAPLAFVELEWRTRLQHFDHGLHRSPDHVRDMWRAAFAEPRLRRLRPVSSHYRLWFSTVPHFPFENVGVAIDPRADGTYQIWNRWRSRAGDATLPEPVTVATATEAAALAAAALPPELH